MLVVLLVNEKKNKMKEKKHYTKTDAAQRKISKRLDVWEESTSLDRNLKNSDY